MQSYTIIPINKIQATFLMILKTYSFFLYPNHNILITKQLHVVYIGKLVTLNACISVLSIFNTCMFLQSVKYVMPSAKTCYYSFSLTPQSQFQNEFLRQKMCVGLKLSPHFFNCNLGGLIEKIHGYEHLFGFEGPFPNTNHLTINYDGGLEDAVVGDGMLAKCRV